MQQSGQPYNSTRIIQGLMIRPSSWFPAAWMPLVIDAVREKSYMHSTSVSQLGVVAFTDQSQFELPEAQEFSCRVKRWQVDQSGCAPSYNHASTSIDSHSTLKCLLLSSPDFAKESFMTCSYRRQRWPGIMPLAVGSWSVSCYLAPWKLTNGCIKSEPTDTCGLCK